MHNLATNFGQQTLSSLFYEPDTLSQYGYFRVFRQKPPTVAEERLMFAVLTDAIECFQRHERATCRKNRALYNEAAEWISSRDVSWPFSFENVCETLGVNPSYLRLGLMRWRHHRVQRKAGSKRLREPLRYQYRVRRRRVGFYAGAGRN